MAGRDAGKLGRAHGANLRAPFVLMQRIRRAPCRTRREGVVVNMLDQRVWSLTPHFVSYTVSKAGLWTLTQTHGAGAGAAHPGRAASGRARRCRARGRPRRNSTGKARSVPLGHGTSPEEVARAVLAMLALPSLTGQMLALDGGQHLQWGARQRGDGTE